jgi:hypothetical protein
VDAPPLAASAPPVPTAPPEACAPPLLAPPVDVTVAPPVEVTVAPPVLETVVAPPLPGFPPVPSGVDSAGEHATTNKPADKRVKNAFAVDFIRTASFC